jgi:hypothetical protein
MIVKLSLIQWLLVPLCWISHPWVILLLSEWAELQCIPLCMLPCFCVIRAVSALAGLHSSSCIAFNLITFSNTVQVTFYHTVRLLQGTTEHLTPSVLLFGP